MDHVFTLGNYLIDRLQKSPNDRKLGEIRDGHLIEYSSQDYINRIFRIAAGLTSTQLQSKIAILSNTSLTWHLLDMAIISNRDICVPIYPTNTASEILYILLNGDIETLIVEDKIQFLKFLEIQDSIPQNAPLKKIISIDTVSSLDAQKIATRFSCQSLSSVESQGVKLLEQNPKLIIKRIESQTPRDVATIIYTSGTTGVPKGVVVTQRALCAMLDNVAEMKTHFGPADTALVFLPLSHVYGRCDSMVTYALGVKSIYAESINKVMDNIKLVGPTLMLSVPRIFEKIYAQVVEQIESSSPIKQAIFRIAEKYSNEYFETLHSGKKPTLIQQLLKKAAFDFVFSKIYHKFGGHIRYFISGGAPISKNIITFLRNAHLHIIEGYGLTETIAPCLLNPIDEPLPGSVGRPLGDVQVKLSEESEILLKSEALFTEYYKMPLDTSEAFVQGWFKTGDLGIISDDGRVTITGRKKELIITSGGKNIAPQKIELMLTKSRFIEFAVTIGDRRKYLTALISLNFANLKNWAAENGIKKEITFAECSQNKEVFALIQKEIDQVNGQLARFETIKKFYLLPKPLTIDDGTITPSLKVKRAVVQNLYKDAVESLYEDQLF